MRYTALATIGALFLFAAYRSSDPVSRAVYGTFSVGQRDMYRMSSVARAVHAAPGRDELVYNLQFTGYDHVQNALFRACSRRTRRCSRRRGSARWNLWSQLDAVTRERIDAPGERHRAALLGRRDLLASPQRPHDVWFLSFSNFQDRDSSLASLRPLYREVGVERAIARGHVLVAHHLELIAP